MADLATAYVKIMPSAKGLGKSIISTLNSESEGAGDSAGTSIGSRLVSGLKSVVSTANVSQFLGNALNEGAALEQSIGGIETLFKDSASTMIQYANEAYRTAGVSANEYMEQTTSFAAALVSSCGGNTAEAAEIANMAMIDMSDNANKMGTDIGNLQNAYQGFAKQNYTINIMSYIAVTLYRACVNLIRGVGGRRLLTGKL